MKIFLCIFILFTGYGALLFVLHAVYSFVKGGCGKTAPFVITPKFVRKQVFLMAEKLLKEASDGQTVVDLGSGTGALLIPLAKRFPNHQFVGYEWDFIPLLWAKWRSRALKNVTWYRQDFMTAHFESADLIFCYILASQTEPLGLKLSNEMKETAHVISMLYPLNHLVEQEALESVFMGLPFRVYVYCGNGLKNI